MEYLHELLKELDSQTTPSFQLISKVFKAFRKSKVYTLLSALRVVCSLFSHNCASKGCLIYSFYLIHVLRFVGQMYTLFTVQLTAKV
jgi:hypothetical protein